MKFIEFFDKIFILNLKERVDRRKEIEIELQKIGINPEDKKVVFYPAQSFTEAYPFYRIGSKGCYYSTLDMLKKAREEKVKNVLILQDDLNFINDFKKYEEEIIYKLNKENWEIVQFGYIPEKKSGKFEFEKSIEEFTGAHFVGFNGEKLDKVIDFLELLLTRKPGDILGGPMPIDGAFNFYANNITDANRLILVPALGYQRSSESNCEIKGIDKMPVVKVIITMGRKIRNKLKRR